MRARALWVRRLVVALVVLLPAVVSGSGRPAEPLVASMPVPWLAMAAAAEDLGAWTVPAQQVQGGTILVARHHRPARTSRAARAEQADNDRFFTISATGSNNLPDAALRAYQHAAAVAPCAVPWTLLAAVGRVESDHGRYGGSVLGSDGVSRPEIVGPRLDGAGPFAAVRDTDRGALDGDRVWDRAVGPMQFLPSTWLSVASDGDGDGAAVPSDLDDAALGAARYLCRSGSDLSDPATMAAALYRYNPSDYYVALVMAFERGYRTGVFVTPSPPPPPDEGSGHPARPGSATVTGSGGSSPGQAPGPAATPTAPTTPAAPSAAPTSPDDSPSSGATEVSTPSSTPSATPTPTPSATASPTPSGTPTTAPAPAAVTLQGTWAACGTGWCLDATVLDLGDASTLGAQARADFDGDQTVETNQLEFEGLAGTRVAVTGEQLTGPSRLGVSAINGHQLR